MIRAVKDRATYIELTQLPNIGPATAADLRLLGIRSPAQLVGRDPYAMYDSLCRGGVIPRNGRSGFAQQLKR